MEEVKVRVCWVKLDWAFGSSTLNGFAVAGDRKVCRKVVGHLVWAMKDKTIERRGMVC